MPTNLLLVEDDPAIGETICHMLQEAGYRCEWVSTGRAAVALVETGVLSVDLFVIDVRLPDITGPTLARQLREGLPSAPVLFVSAYPEPTDEPMPDVHWAFLPKPFTSEQLCEAVGQLLTGGLTPPQPC
jgi:two-component system, cell cycle sensor histidine kinase and response regulator CckA